MLDNLIVDFFLDCYGGRQIEDISDLCYIYIGWNESY